MFFNCWQLEVEGRRLKIKGGGEEGTLKVRPLKLIILYLMQLLNFQPIRSRSGLLGIYFCTLRHLYYVKQVISPMTNFSHVLSSYEEQGSRIESSRRRTGAI